MNMKHYQSWDFIRYLDATHIRDRWEKSFTAANSDLSPTTRLVLHFLAYYLDKTGRCSPSQRVLIKQTSLSRVVVMKHLKIAESKGWIKQRLKRDGYEYRALFPKFTVINGGKKPVRKPGPYAEKEE